MNEEKLTIEESLEKIREITERLEKGGLSLEESLKEYEKGIRLVREAGTLLGDAEKKLQVLTEGEENV